MSRAKTNRVLPRKCTGNSKHPLQQHKRRLHTWTSPDGQHRNQIDYIPCSHRWRCSIQSAKTKLGADCDQIMNSLLPNSDWNWRKEGKPLDHSNESEVAQLCLTLCDPVDCSPPGSSIHGILQARILERVAISFSRGSSRPRDWTQVSSIAGRWFNLWATREAPDFDHTLG